MAEIKSLPPVVEVFKENPFSLPSSLMQELQTMLQLPISEQNLKSLQALYVVENKLVFFDEELGSLSIDLLNDHVNYQKKAHRGKQELIAKALGLNKGLKTVLDLTFGLGQDALFITELGAQVSGVERNPSIYLLLKMALLEAEVPIQLSFGDSKEYLRSMKESGILPQVIYMDPMFPSKKKSALPRKEMQIFRKLAGDDADSAELLSAALDSAQERVVVKRPLKAPDLLPGKVHSYEGTTIRYDVYRSKGGAQ
jgi:16S rRNA (guanine1516-N2)-methyltransferase